MYYWSTQNRLFAASFLLALLWALAYWAVR